MVFQDFETQLFTSRVMLEVAFGLENLALPREEMLPRIARALTRVGLAGCAERNPNTLSGGQKQRLVIAAVAALMPGLLLMDEPTTDLDPLGRAEVLALMRELRRAGTGLIIADHDIEELAEADRLLVLRHGTVGAGSPDRAGAAPTGKPAPGWDCGPRGGGIFRAPGRPATAGHAGRGT